MLSGTAVKVPAPTRGSPTYRILAIRRKSYRPLPARLRRRKGVAWTHCPIEEVPAEVLAEKPLAAGAGSRSVRSIPLMPACGGHLARRAGGQLGRQVRRLVGKIGTVTGHGLSFLVVRRCGGRLSAIAPADLAPARERLRQAIDRDDAGLFQHIRVYHVR